MTSPASVETPEGPCGIVKFSTAPDGLPALVTVAEVPGAPVVVVPTETVAADPAGPVGPVGPVVPVNPVSPRGIVKFSTAADDVPPLVTLADVAGALVTVEPTATVAAVPADP